MVNKKRIKFGLHFPIIIAILFLHTFASDIYLHFYLQNVEKNFLENTVSGNGSLYKSGEYTPILKEESSFSVPNKYEFVFVENRDNVTEETYYTMDGDKVKAFYINGKIQKVSGKSGPKMAYFIVPVLGFVFVLFANLRESARTGKFFSWQLGKSPDYIEKLFYLYGVSFFAIGLFIIIVKEVWFI